MEKYEENIYELLERFNLTENTSDEEINTYYFILTQISKEDSLTVVARKKYLCEYLLDMMVRSKEITLKQRNNFKNRLLN